MTEPEVTRADAFSVGALVGNYRIVRLLGAGGMGAVYEALHEALDKRVAIKTLRPELARDLTARARFVREGRAACKIRHPHVVEVFDVGEHAQTPYLVMELLDGEDLASRLQREGSLSVERAADVLLPALAAVATAHEEGVVHRDLKPENLFLARVRNGVEVVKVVDFGISRTADVAEPRLTGTGAMVGTPMYFAPEQCRGGQADARSDQYSLGVVLYECLTGRVPFDGSDFYALIVSVAEGRFATPRSVRPELPEALEALILRAMAREPAARFDDIRAFGRALLPFAGAPSRAMWRGVFEAALTPPIAPMPSRGAGADSLAGVSRCAIVTGFVRSPRYSVPAVGALALGLVCAAIMVPGRSTRTRAAVVRHVETPVVSHASTPVTPVLVRAREPLHAVEAVDAGSAPPPPVVQAAPPGVRPAVRRDVRRVVDAHVPTPPATGVREPAVPLCGGVPCP